MAGELWIIHAEDRCNCTPNPVFQSYFGNYCEGVGLSDQTMITVVPVQPA